MKIMIAALFSVSMAMAERPLQGMEKFRNYHLRKDKAASLAPLTKENQLVNPATMKRILAAFSMSASYRNEADKDVDLLIHQGEKTAEYRYNASEYSYTDRSVKGLAGSAKEGDLTFLPQAESMLARLFGGANQMRFVNTETTFSQNGAEQPKVESITYRFLPKVNGRFVLGSAFHARIEFGANGAIRSFVVRLPALKTGQASTRRFKDGFSQRKLMAQNTRTWEKMSEHELAPASSTLLETLDSYVLAEPINGSILVPSQTYLVRYDLVAGKSRTAHLSVPESPDFETDPGITEDDIEEVPEQ